MTSDAIVRNRYRLVASFWYLCTLIKIASDTGPKKHELLNHWQRNSCVNGHIYCIFKIRTRMKICWRHWRTKSEQTFRVRQMWHNMAVTPLHASLAAQYKFWRKRPNGFRTAYKCMGTLRWRLLPTLFCSEAQDITNRLIFQGPLRWMLCALHIDLRTSRVKNVEHFFPQV